MKDVQATGEVIIPQKRTSSTLKLEFSGSFWPSWIRIRIPNARPDPQHWYKDIAEAMLVSVSCFDFRNPLATTAVSQHRGWNEFS
jgi:hypothetical protein